MVADFCHFVFPCRRISCVPDSVYWNSLFYQTLFDRSLVDHLGLPFCTCLPESETRNIVVISTFEFRDVITTRRKSAVFSLFRPSLFNAKTLRHDKQRARARKISPCRHENLNNEVFVPSRVQVSLFRLECLVYLCLRPKGESRNNNKELCFRVFAFRLSGLRHENTKWQKSATLIFLTTIHQIK
jgi:hypothetical protein